MRAGAAFALHRLSTIPKSGSRISEKIMLQPNIWTMVRSNVIKSSSRAVDLKFGTRRANMNEVSGARNGGGLACGRRFLYLDAGAAAEADREQIARRKSP